MPLRPVNRDQGWLLPPALDDLLAQDHPARFVAAFVDGLDRASWAEMEIGVEGDPLGAPAYHPHLLLSVWLYGFMTGIRSSRKLEAACRDQISFLWLTGWHSRPQHPLAILPSTPTYCAQPAEAHRPDRGGDREAGC